MMMPRTPEINDSLDGIFGKEAPPKAEVHVDRGNFKTGKDYEPTVNRLVVEKCKSCRGTGRFYGYSGRDFGPCYKCKGKGERAYKTTTEQRARQREKAADKRTEAQAKLAEEIRAYTETHKELVNWLIAAKQRNIKRDGTFDFPAKMIEAIDKYGSLTDAQVAACEKLMAKDKERQAEWAKRDATRVEMDAGKITEAFAKARGDASLDGDGLLNLKLRLDTFQFSPDRQNVSDVWVKEGNTWCGKIEGGKFKRFKNCTDDQEARIKVCCDDPAAAAKAYGLRFKNCSCCGRVLTNEQSRQLGIGPICAAKWGLA
jgi:hypothetical protein